MVLNPVSLTPALDMAFKLPACSTLHLKTFSSMRQRILCKHLSSDSKLLWFRVWFRAVHWKGINAIKFARNEAARAQKSQVEPEHLLAGFVDPTTTVLIYCERMAARWTSKPMNLWIRENSGFSPQSKFVLELPSRSLQGKKSIGTEHLWGLVRLAETDNTTLVTCFNDTKLISNLWTINSQKRFNFRPKPTDITY